MAALLTTAGLCVLCPWWIGRLGLSVLEALLILRCFSMYHDHLHGAFLRRSTFASAVFFLFGLLTLTPMSVWREHHNHHHAHTNQLLGSHIGSFPLMTTTQWRQASPQTRLGYRVARHPVTILLGLLTVFFFGMCIRPLQRDPWKHRSAGLALALHLGLFCVLYRLYGLGIWLTLVVLPLALSAVAGSYLFFVQHNFPSARVLRRAGWTRARAALEASSFVDLGPVGHWFTGNIGYHHVHHLNEAVPFYRLPEVMEKLPALQSPARVTLAPADVAACLRLALWDPDAQEMVGYPR